MMMMIKRFYLSLPAKRGNHILIALLAIFVSTNATAQVNDFQSWLSLSVKTDISKKCGSRP